MEERPLKPRIGAEKLQALDRAKDLRRQGKNREAEILLEALIEKEEADADDGGVEHWYYEHLAVLYDERLARQLERDFLRDLDGCVPFDAQEYQGRSVLLRYRDSVSRLLSPLL